METSSDTKHDMSKSLMKKSLNGEVDERITSWFSAHYQVSAFMTLPRDYIYLKFVAFCESAKLPETNRRGLDLIIKTVFPTVQLKRKRPAGRSRFVYGLEEKETTNETTSALHHSGTQNWMDLPSDMKLKSQQSAMEWLRRNFEINPGICLLRSAVYDSYRQFCKTRSLVSATATIFGKYMQETFQQLMVRRLGQRGHSRYFCMGIDVLSDSPHYKAIRVNRIRRNIGKPKLNRTFNGARKNR